MTHSLPSPPKSRLPGAVPKTSSSRAWSNALRLALQEILNKRAALDEDASFLAANSSEDERPDGDRFGDNARAPLTLTPAAALPSLPTLTLSVDFPLPPYRQPGRSVRRLRTNRTRRQPLAHIEAGFSPPAHNSFITGSALKLLEYAEPFDPDRYLDRRWRRSATSVNRTHRLPSGAGIPPEEEPSASFAFVTGGQFCRTELRAHDAEQYPDPRHHGL